MAISRDGAGMKLLLIYDPLPEQREEYFNYVLGEFVPALESLGLKLCEAWHTASGEYPLRLTAFEAADRDTLQAVLASERFLELENRLQDYVVNYRRKIVSEQRRGGGAPGGQAGLPGSLPARPAAAGRWPSLLPGNGLQSSGGTHLHVGRYAAGLRSLPHQLIRATGGKPPRLRTRTCPRHWRGQGLVRGG